MNMPPKSRTHTRRFLAVALLTLACLLATGRSSQLLASSLRETPAVRAVRNITPSVVNIRSEKTVTADSVLYATRAGQKVAGMGTGVVVDRRGYIVTNYHVIAGVDWLRVTLSDGGVHTARIVSFDRQADLAIIKVDAGHPLPEMPLGTSSDLMLAETVFAIGNAYGYEDTVTCGIVSALHREVEVNKTQTYHNLIQTDASINPGNSGGPLINLEGHVVGINVAIRAGAQRIGFAIPIDEARRVIAKLIAIERLTQAWHGLKTTDDKQGARRQLVVTGTETDSPAAAAGLKTGDVIVRSEQTRVVDRVDLERSLLDHKSGTKAELTIVRNGKTTKVSLMLSRRQAAETAELNDSAQQTWQAIGLKLEVVRSQELEKRHGRQVLDHYRGGLRVTGVRDKGPAASHGIRNGDVLVGLHEWETVNLDNVRWVLDHPELRKFNPVKFYVLRGRETLFGHLPIQSATR
jgi:serine protease Do